MTRGADVRNEIILNYGNNYGSQETAIDLTSIAAFGYRGETLNTVLHDATDAQAVADRFIALRSYPRALFDSITFPLTNSAIDDADRDTVQQIRALVHHRLNTVELARALAFHHIASQSPRAS